MNIGILDCKVSGKHIEEIERYRAHGYDIINAGALDKPTKNYDVLASTWTQLSAKRLQNVNCRAVVVKDNDEPFNVIQQSTIDQLNVRVQLIGLWGISTRVDWNMKQVELYAPEIQHALIVANTPSHDVIKAELETKRNVTVDYRLLKDIAHRERLAYDLVIVHLSKDDFKKYEFDVYLGAHIAQKLLISTTRGAIFSSKAINIAVANRTPETAVLDWAWEREKLENGLIADKRIVLTNHTSYQSEQSRKELTAVTIEAVEKIKTEL